MPRSGVAASHLPHTLPSALHTSLVVEDVLHTTWTEINRPHVVPARAPATPLLPAKTPPVAHSDPRKYSYTRAHSCHTSGTQPPDSPRLPPTLTARSSRRPAAKKPDPPSPHRTPSCRAPPPRENTSPLSLFALSPFARPIWKRPCCRFDHSAHALDRNPRADSPFHPQRTALNPSTRSARTPAPTCPLRMPHPPGRF